MKYGRTILFAFISSSLFMLALASAQDTPNPPHGEQITGPACQVIPDWDSARAATCTKADIADWLSDIKHWRAEHLLRMGYEGSQYARPELASCSRR
jgi:hypothetical protein